MQQRLPVHVQLGSGEPSLVGWVDVGEHDGPGEIVAHLAKVLRKVADEFEEQQRYSRHERD